MTVRKLNRISKGYLICPFWDGQRWQAGNEENPWKQ
jgi:hypothetical protein